MLSKKEVWVIILTASATLSILALLDRFVISHNLQPVEPPDAASKFALLSVKPSEISSDPVNLRTGAKQEQAPIAPTKLPPVSSIRNTGSEPNSAAGGSTGTSSSLARSHAVHTSSQSSIAASKLSELIPPGSKCPRSVEQAYRTAAGDYAKSLGWCKHKQQNNHVAIGRSWGTLSKAEKHQWDEFKCNELLSVGKLQSCDQRWGWGFFNDWLHNAVPVVQGVSNVTCARDIKTSSYCQYGDVTMDFSKITTHPTTRGFSEGFLTARGEMKNFAHIPKVPGFLVQEGRVSSTAKVGEVTLDLAKMHADCDIVESRPTFVLSNDDIYNLGHYYNDVMGIWGMLAMAGVNSKDAVLLNMDGLRAGGPAGVGSHRIMVPGKPDEHGPYISYFKSWFGEVQKTVDFGGKKVCYKELYLPPMPGVPWFWNDWSQINDCSMQAPSPLYQSYNLFMRQHWRAAYGAASLPNPPTNVVHVVIEVRAINPNKRSNNHSSARHISNLAALIAELEKIPGVKVTAQDFAKIPFEQQVALSHSAGVFISMHGAGTTHIFHAALGQPNCCALVELFPDTTVELHAAQGYGNLARMLGFHHWRNVAALGKTRAGGTEVDVPEVTQLVTQAVQAVRTKPTCLHDVKDTTQSLYGKDGVFSH